MANTVAIYNFKGGVGKTTTSLNLGYAWSRSFKVLLIDCDPQCNLTIALGARESENSIFGYLKGLVHNKMPDKIIPFEISSYLHLIPGDYRMVSIETNSQFITFGPSIIQKLNYAIKKDYDIIILDLPTHFGLMVKAFLVNTESILIPTIPDSFSIAGVKKLLTYLYTVQREKPLNILGIYFNMYKDSLIYHRVKYRESTDVFGSLILDSRVSNSVKVSEATDEGKFISKVSPDNTVAREFQQLSDELLAKFNCQFLNNNLISEDFLHKIEGIG